jgi:hypothetical protein
MLKHPAPFSGGKGAEAHSNPPGVSISIVKLIKPDI